MNILPHKSWHVYNQKNRERVQRDEAQAKEQEQQANDRAVKAEREYRLSELRRKAKARQSNATDTEPLDQSQKQDSNQPLITPPTPGGTKPRHINFWADVETQGKNDKSHQRKSVPEKNEGVGLTPLEDMLEITGNLTSRILIYLSDG
ncbi:Leukocyte receptor cluster member 1 [Mortierella sp. AD010]|nr:Leukocyte receptor cluster member 1 [Mortierella sp. AD010]